MSDPIIQVYKADVDRTLLRENLKLTPQQRFDKFAGVMRNLMNLRAAGDQARQKRQSSEAVAIESNSDAVTRS